VEQRFTVHTCVLFRNQVFVIVVCVGGAQKVHPDL
jgi:hypothetical protein